MKLLPSFTRRDALAMGLASVLLSPMAGAAPRVSDWARKKKRVRVHDREMAYVEAASRPISSAWAIRTNSPTAVPAGIRFATTSTICTRCWTCCMAAPAGSFFAKLRSPEGERVRSYSDWLVSESDQPKLFVRADPNAIGRALARWIAAL
jgi:hypothetical protein